MLHKALGLEMLSKQVAGFTHLNRDYSQPTYTPT